VPRPPKHDFRHWEANDGKTLRFTAQFLPGAPNVLPPNDERRFVVTLYMVGPEAMMLATLGWLVVTSSYVLGGLV